MISITLSDGPRAGTSINVRDEAYTQGRVRLYEIGGGYLIYDRHYVFVVCPCGNHPEGHRRIDWLYQGRDE